MGVWLRLGLRRPPGLWALLSNYCPLVHLGFIQGPESTDWSVVPCVTLPRGRKAQQKREEWRWGAGWAQSRDQTRREVVSEEQVLTEEGPAQRPAPRPSTHTRGWERLGLRGGVHGVTAGPGGAGGGRHRRFVASAGKEGQQGAGAAGAGPVICGARLAGRPRWRRGLSVMGRGLLEAGGDRGGVSLARGRV